MARGDEDRLAHIVAAARRAVSLVQGHTRADLDADDVLALALTRLLEILGEAAKGVSAETRARHPHIPWTQMAATRDRLIHGYFSVVPLVSVILSATTSATWLRAASRRDLGWGRPASEGR